MVQGQGNEAVVTSPRRRWLLLQEYNRPPSEGLSAGVAILASGTHPPPDREVDAGVDCPHDLLEDVQRFLLLLWSAMHFHGLEDRLLQLQQEIVAEYRGVEIHAPGGELIHGDLEVVLELHCRPPAGCGFRFNDNYSIFLIHHHCVDCPDDQSPLGIINEFKGEGIFNTDYLLRTWGLGVECLHETDPHIHVRTDVGPYRRLTNDTASP